jgi:hypothetical protein
MARHCALATGGSQGENLVLRDVRRRRLGVVTFLKASCSGAPSLVVAELAGGAAGGALVRVAVWALRAHGLWMA